MSVEWYPGKKREIGDRARKALQMTAQAVVTDLLQRQVLPFAEDSLANRRRGVVPGELQGSVHVDRTRSAQGTVSVVTSTPYARRLYYHPEYSFYKGENPHAGGGWYEHYKRGKGLQWLKSAYKKMLERQG